MFNVQSKKYPYLFFFLFIIRTGSVYAAEGTMGDWIAKGATAYPSACDMTQLELFSCQDNLKRVVAVCMGGRDKKIELDLKSPHDNTLKFPLDPIYQDISIASGGGATIMRGITKNGFATLYLDLNRADESGSAVVLPDNSILDCNTASIRVPSHTIKDLSNKVELINIWFLKNKGFTNDFVFNGGSEKIKFREKMKLWGTWPK